MSILMRAGFACVLTACAGGAAAHVVASPDAGTAGGYFRTDFRVSHGCAGSATTAVRITIPDGVLGARGRPKPGWRLETRRRTLPNPVTNGHGGSVAETTAELIWRGGPLPDDQFDEFGVLMHLPDAAGTTLHFAVVQECEQGRLEWAEVPKHGQPRSDLHAPAPFVRLLPR